MRILIIVPRQPRETGNWVTAERFADGYVTSGHQVQLTETPQDSPATTLAAVEAFHPDVVLLLHAYRSGKPWLLSGLSLPCLVLPTGTDLHHDQADPDKKSVIDRVLQQAVAILLQNRQDYADLQTHANLAGKLHYLPCAAILGTQELLLDKPDCVLLLHPAGIRPVKGNLELLMMCDKLREQCNFQLAFCGPELDADYAARFQEALASRPWASYLGCIPQQAMASLMRQADVILNNSASEGISNALVEASCLGKPILARDNSGNRLVVESGCNGLLYSTEEDFVRQAGRLISDKAFRSKLEGQLTDRFAGPQEADVLNQLLLDISAPAL
jgi:glycosyltransferase involved in cell wall biosynthesis